MVAGPKGVAAIKKRQRELGVKVDGVWGPVSKNADARDRRNRKARLKRNTRTSAPRSKPKVRKKASPERKSARKPSARKPSSRKGKGKGKGKGGWSGSGGSGWS
jgi:peptidoglycan hydrolase-like protein with peptidoglycan-binding domain